MTNWRHRVAALAMLAAAASPAAARGLPSRAQFLAALHAFEACGGGGNGACDPPIRRRVTAARCLLLPPDPSYPGRVLCIFSGTIQGGGLARPARVDDDCLYLMPAGHGRWRVSSIPDADMCG
jgi:hypothetical protein